MAETERVFLKSREYYIGVAPSEPDKVYYDRTSAAGWEVVIVTKLDNGLYSALFEAANRLLSLQPDGTFQTREPGALGSWEQIAGGVAMDGPLKGQRILGPFVVESV